MDIGKIISDSIKYPLSDFGKLLVLGIIMIIPIVNFVGLGYFIRAIKSNLAGLSELPSFDEFVELFIDGIKVFIVGIAYFIIPIIILIVASLLTSSTTVIDTPGYFSFDTTESYPAITGASLVLSLIGILLTLITYPFLIMGLANMAYYGGELSAAFNFSEIINRIKRIGRGEFIIWYIVLWVIGILAGIVFSVIFFILFITLIGWILIPMLFILASSYLKLLLARYISILFKSSI